jgi:hypothetical protein
MQPVAQKIHALRVASHDVRLRGPAYRQCFSSPDTDTHLFGIAPTMTTSAGERFLFLNRPADSHTYVSFSRGANIGEALLCYVSHMDGDVSPEVGGGLRMRLGRGSRSYPHVIAFIEAIYKTHGEWQVRQLPDWLWDCDFEEGLLLGEHPDEVQSSIRECTPLLRATYPRSRARGFVWYLDTGVLVTFYRRRRPFEIEVLGRFLIDKSQDYEVVPWQGDYEDILQHLYLQPSWWQDRKGLG